MNDASQRNVLVVDDEPGVREIVKTYLEYGKMNVTAAVDGDEALKLAGKKEFDVVLSDIMMPRMNRLDTIAGKISEAMNGASVILWLLNEQQGVNRLFCYQLSPFFSKGDVTDR